MFKFALCLSVCLLIGACFGTNQESGGATPTDQEVWTGDSDPVGSYAAEAWRFTQSCQDGSGQVVTSSGSEVHIDVVREASAPLRLYTFTAVYVDFRGTHTYVFEKSGVRDDGSFRVWKDATDANGRFYVELFGRFETSNDGATRVTGQLVKNALEYPVPGHICSDVHEFGTP
ncbi:MAG: hypothetical protein WC866_02670 [Patescibacteria group bacterium]|jgi:hypothetical protein